MDYWVTTTAGKCWGCGKLADEVPIMYVNGANYRYCLTCRFDARVVKHDEGCDEWCNHCETCGCGILYGSRCPDHPNTEGWSEAYRNEWFADRQ